MSLTASRRVVFEPFSSARLFHVSSTQLQGGGRRRRGQNADAAKRVDGLEVTDAIIDPVPDDVDTSVLGHLMLQQKRHKLYYMRLIEHEIPRLVAYRKFFVPPSDATPLVVRSISYGGEEHAAQVKRTITVPVSRLPLKDASAVHKFKVLAGPRWTPQAPRDAGLAPSESAEAHGYFKISCEDFPKAAMNLKWASDALDRLLVEANDGEDKFEDIPVDTRHVEAKIRKARKGDHVYGRGGHRPTIRDFPKEWLPQTESTFPASS